MISCEVCRVHTSHEIRKLCRSRYEDFWTSIKFRDAKKFTEFLQGILNSKFCNVLWASGEIRHPLRSLLNFCDVPWNSAMFLLFFPPSAAGRSLITFHRQDIPIITDFRIRPGSEWSKSIGELAVSTDSFREWKLPKRQLNTLGLVESRSNYEQH